jgi:hypothetical protein
VNGNRPLGFLAVGFVGGGVPKVTPSTVRVTDGPDVGPPPAGHAGLLGLVVAKPCVPASGIVSSVALADAVGSVARAREGVEAIAALQTSTAIAHVRGRRECARVAGVQYARPWQSQSPTLGGRQASRSVVLATSS